MDQQTLRALITYNPNTGLFSCKFTEEVLNKVEERYERVSLLGLRFWAHRLAWFYMTGVWPKHIDHINGDGHDNRWVNLRNSTHSQNLANSYPLTRGVEIHGRKWRARIWVENKRIELGSYETKEAAQAAYNAGAIKYFGEFARCNRPEL